MTARAAWPLLKLCAFTKQVDSKTRTPALYFLNQTPGKAQYNSAWDVCPALWVAVIDSQKCCRPLASLCHRLMS